MEKPQETPKTDSVGLPADQKTKTCSFTSFKEVLDGVGSEIRSTFKSLGSTLASDDWKFCRKISSQQLKNHGKPEI